MSVGLPEEELFYGLRFNLFDHNYVNDVIKFKVGGVLPDKNETLNANMTELTNHTEVLNITKEVLFAQEFAHILDKGHNITNSWTNLTVLMTAFKDFKMVQSKECYLDATLETLSLSL